MPKPPPLGPTPAPDPEADEILDTGAYAVEPRGAPASPRDDLAALVAEEVGRDTSPQWRQPEPGLPEEPGAAEPPPPRQHFGTGLKVTAVIAVVALATAATLLYRSHHRKEVLAQGIARARELMRPDTFGGYRDAVQLLEPLAQIDPMEAGSLRAFALAMLAGDYRDEDAGQRAESLLIEPERAPLVPPAAYLARAALLLPRQAGSATTFAARAPGSPWSGTLQARVALLAGNFLAGAELADAALALDRDFPAALAVKGDVLRRRLDFDGARAAYEAALQRSPQHPRAAFGLAKLALSEKAPLDQAARALERLLSDRATPRHERARAALHLAALRGRARDRAGAAAALDAADVPAPARPWMEKAAVEEEVSRAGYHVVDGAPPAVQSSSDDDPYQLPPPPPPETAAPAETKPAKAAVVKRSKASRFSKRMKLAKRGKSAKGSRARAKGKRVSKKAAARRAPAAAER